MPRAVAVLLFVGMVSSAAPPLPLDLVPQEACLGFAARDLADALARAQKLHPGKAERDHVEELQRELQLAWKLDARQPLSFVCMAGTLGGFGPNADPQGSYSLGASLAFADRADALRQWELKPADLQKAGPLRVPGAKIQIPGLFGAGQTIELNRALVRDERVYLASNNDKAVANWTKAPTLRPRLTRDQQARYDAADALFYIGPAMWRAVQPYLFENDPPTGYTAQEAESFRRAQRVWRDIDHLLAVARIDEGVGLDVLTQFRPQGKDAAAILKALSASKRASNLRGLPEGKPLAALGLVGLDATGIEAARLLTSQLWFGPGDQLPILGSDAVHLRRIVANLVTKLHVGRAALYPARAKDLGQLALVAVLEPRDAAAFLKEIAGLARVADPQEFDPKAGAGKAEIEKLVADLAADDYDTREAASTRLALIGDPILPYLEKLPDAEARRRADELRTQIQHVAALRKQELASGLLKKAFHPTFGYKANAEQRAGASVHLLALRLDVADAPFANWLAEMFGPDWKRIRLAEVGGKLVALVGSDVALVEEAIRTVRADKPGLDASPALANFRKNTWPDRRAELHLALERVTALTTPAERLPPNFKPTDDLASIGLRTGPGQLGLDFWFPPRAAVRLLPWWPF